MELKPFNLEKAQAGHPWGTRSRIRGKKVFDTEREGNNRLIAILEDGGMPFCDIDGTYYKTGVESAYDLFLYEEKKKGWVVIFVKDGELDCHIAESIDDRDNAERYFKEHSTYIKTVEFDY